MATIKKNVAHIKINKWIFFRRYYWPKHFVITVTVNINIGCSFKFAIKVGDEESIVNASLVLNV
jgi:hypothetical protein